MRLESKAPLLDVWKRSQYSRNRNLKIKLKLIKKGTKKEGNAGKVGHEYVECIK